MKRIAWTLDAWDEYLSWIADDRQMARRINTLIKDIVRADGDSGIGKPELLRGDLAGWSSRRINQEHRLVYQVVDDELVIGSCRYHYR
ncbi:Txe/YoeB family addiction module toxin [Actinoplanes sp. NPDC051494]|uniref:Txe/YoeB family addiction module toxin n=1 Tax=Actinoplanes sp. NPDC051494 TaxID=3363907 RepID=UPI0037939B11